jgi:ABC-type branched-subunit amino acid transport system substrate-binding protein
VKYSADSQGKAVGCMAVGYHPKRVAFLHIEDPFPEAQIKSMTPELQAGGAKVVANESFPFAATDITPQVQKIKAADPDLLIVFAYFNAMSTAIKGIDAIGLNNVQIVGDAEAAAAPPSSFLASSTPMPKNFVAMQWAINTRVNGQLTSDQTTAIDAVSPALKGQFNAVLATYLYTYDALELIKWAAEKTKSDKSSDMVKQLESLSGTPTENTHAHIVNPPPYSSSFHGNKGKMYVVDVSGKYVSGTFPEVRPIPDIC